MNKLSDYFDKIKNISHAFLIGNVVFDEIEIELEKILKEKIFKTDSLKIRENPDIYIFDENDKLITKDNIKELINNLSLTSQFNNKKVYIINGAEKMSDSVYNSLLKTLEEPESNIYAFLITKNIENISETIKSRCQKIYLNSFEEKEYDENLNEIAERLIKDIENNNIKTIALDPQIYDLIEDRNIFRDILLIIQNKYNLELKEIIKNENNKKNCEKNVNNDIITLSKKILVVDKFINLLDSYLNKNLTVDRFLIEMWRCYR